MGGAQAPASQRIFKQFTREVNAVLPKLEATCPLRWSQCAITFNSADQLKCAATAGVPPKFMAVTHHVYNILKMQAIAHGS